MNAYLLLANGMVFAGQSVGAEGVLQASRTI